MLEGLNIFGPVKIAPSLIRITGHHRRSLKRLQKQEGYSVGTSSVPHQVLKCHTLPLLYSTNIDFCYNQAIQNR